MEQPSSGEIRAAQAVELLRSISILGIVVGFADLFGGGPQYVTGTIVLGFAAAFVVTTVVLQAVTMVWMRRYLDMQIGVGQVAVMGVTWAVCVGIPAVVYWAAMAPTDVNLALAALIGVGLATRLTEYEFEVNDHTVIGG